MFASVVTHSRNLLSAGGSRPCWAISSRALLDWMKKIDDKMLVTTPQELPSVVEPLGASTAVGEGEDGWEQWPSRVGREPELIVGRIPGETVVVVCHRASVLATTQYSWR